MRTMLARAALAVCVISILAGVWWVLGLEIEHGGFGVLESPAVLEAAPAPNGAGVAVAPGDEADEAVPAGGGILGKAIHVDPDGAIVPLARVLVRLARNEDVAFDEPVAAAASNRRGFFRLHDVPTGEYHLIAFAEGFEPRVVGEIEVRAGVEPEPILLRYGWEDAPGAAADGAGDGSSPAVALSEAAQPADEWKSLNEAAGLQVVESLQDIPVLFEGGHMVSFTLNGAQGDLLWSPPPGPEEREDPADANQPQPGKALIRGMATDLGTAAPLTGADMKLVGIDTNRSSSAGSDGRFRFENVEPGEYAVTFEGMLQGSLFSPSASNVILNVSAGQVLDVDLRARQLVRVDGVVDGGQAQAAGMLEGDMILTYDGVPVASSAHLRELRAAAPPEKDVTIEAERGGGRMSITIHGGTIGVYTSLVYK